MNKHLKRGLQIVVFFLILGLSAGTGYLMTIVFVYNVNLTIILCLISASIIYILLELLKKLK